MKKFLKLGLCFLSLVPISLAVYSCSTNTRVEDDYYYDVNDKSTVKDIDTTVFGKEFWDDLLVYDKTIENNSEILKSNIKIDLRMFKYLQRMESIITRDFFINIIDKWAKQFSTVGIDDFKGQVDYYFPDSFQGFYNDTKQFFLPFQRIINFGKASIKETLSFSNINSNYTECIFPESIEKIYLQSAPVSPGYAYVNKDYLLTLKTIIFPSNFTIEKINYNDNLHDKDYSIFPFELGSFIAEAKKDKLAAKKGDYDYYYYDIDGKDMNDNYPILIFTDEDHELIKQRISSGMHIELSKTFKDNNEALRYIFGWDILDKELELLKSWITYI
ncbi:MAG: hypothetical protein K2N92_01945 [Malacoplasma sp.]|nr:hypothetical protein [Malacoplasma sp.]MDE7112341.1 hypothetical protein [Malacoplasma sp.]